MTYPGPQDPQESNWQQPAAPQYPPYPTGQAYPPFEAGTPMYAGGLQPGFGAVTPPRKRKRLPIVLGVIGGVFVLCLGGTVVAAAASSDDSTGSVAAAVSPSAGIATNPATTKPTTKPAVAATTMPTQKPATAEPVVTTKAPAVTGFKAVSAHEWKLIVKDPAAHAGEKIIIYGTVYQFDPYTGDDMFLAVAGPTKYEDPSDSNAEFTGDSSMLSDLAENDTFRAQAVVMGPDSYDTQDGGNTTVPELKIVSIKTL